MKHKDEEHVVCNYNIGKHALKWKNQIQERHSC